MRTNVLLQSATLLCLVSLSVYGAPYRNGQFQGRIAYSADGNHNDPDDWIASPMTLAILAEAGLKERLVHFDYNCILPLTDPAWEKTHAESVLGAASRYGYDKSLFFDCRQNLDAALDDLARCINASSADNPLYLIIAGPVEVPLRAIRKAEAAKRQYVYCISHSGWNDGYGRNYKYTFTKRSVIEQGVNWLQIRDQNPKLSFGQYGRPATPEEFAPYFWMRDSADARVRFLWERMVVSTRPDPSDAGMAWFLVSGDEECDPVKLKRLMEDHHVPAPVSDRGRTRLEAENFRNLEGCAVESRNDKTASHRLNVRVVDGQDAACLSTRFAEPFTSPAGPYELEVRYLANAPTRFALFMNGEPGEGSWQATGNGNGWTSKRIPDVLVRAGDEIRLEVQGAGARIDYVELNTRESSEPQEFTGFADGARAGAPTDRPTVYAWFPARFGSWKTEGIDWACLTHLCFRSVELTADGKVRRVSGNPPKDFVETAHRHGVKVTVLVWTASRADSDGYLARFPGEAATNLLAYVQKNNLDGVNIDDEQMAATNAVAQAPNRELVTRFFQVLATTFKTANPSYHITFAAPPVIAAEDRFGAGWLDLKGIADVVDGIIPMGYTQNPPTAGWTTNPEPLGGGGRTPWTTSRDMQTMVRDYLDAMGGHRQKLLVGVSLKSGGYEWRCRTDQRLSGTLDKGTWRSFAECEAKVREHGSRWDEAQQSPWYCYPDGNTFVQGWYNDVRAWRSKLDWIHRQGLGGIGIWVLHGADDPPETWQLLREFSKPTSGRDSKSR